MDHFVKLTGFKTGNPVWLRASAVNSVALATEPQEWRGATEIDGESVWAVVRESVEEVLQALTNGLHKAEGDN